MRENIFPYLSMQMEYSRTKLLESLDLSANSIYNFLITVIIIISVVIFISFVVLFNQILVICNTFESILFVKFYIFYIKINSFFYRYLPKLTKAILTK